MRGFVFYNGYFFSDVIKYIMIKFYEISLQPLYQDHHK
jgi:hypothetical protein